MDKNLTIKHNASSPYQLPSGTKIKIDYLAWFIQLLIWNIIVIFVFLLLFHLKIQRF